MKHSSALLSWLLTLMATASVFADEPTAPYIFPAGGQRGKEVEVRVGGTFLHGAAPWEMLGEGISVPARVVETETIWFEGPPLYHPVSSRKEDYPRDHAAKVAIDANTPVGTRLWRVWTSQGATENRPFIIGDLPEVVEQEAEAGLTPMPVTLPVTINGRIFPREEIDVWSFTAAANQEITCSVVARRLGSEIEPRLIVYDAAGKLLAESIDTAGADPTLRFRAPAEGTYHVHIFDVNHEGMQDFVYRLTVTAGPFIDHVYPLGGQRGQEVAFTLAGQNVPTEYRHQLPANAGNHITAHWTFDNQPANPVRVAVGNLPETLEAEPNDTTTAAKGFAIPSTLNGRIKEPGDADLWSFTAEKGTAIAFDLQAARLGSRLDSVLTVEDESGKVLARNDDLSASQTDSALSFTAPQTGTFYVRVADRFAARGGAEFAYRLTAETAGSEPDFSLRASEDVVTLFRDLEPGPDGKPTVRQPQQRRLKPETVKVDVQRMNNFAEEIELVVEGLPAGVTVTGNKVGKNATSANLKFTAAYETTIATARLKIRGVAKVGETTLAREATYPDHLGATTDHLLLAVALEAPFRVEGEFAMAFGAAGSVYEKPYEIKRFGYDGPLEIRLSDRQMRHLQGVTGPTFTVPEGETRFVYPVTLAPWMTLGRTSRSCVMATATVKDHDGSEHVVSYHSVHQNEQVVAVVKPPLLILTLARPYVPMTPGKSVKLLVRVQRAEALADQSIRLELIPPSGIEGFTAEPVTISGEEREATLTLQISAEAKPVAQPLVIRATTLSEKPTIGEVEVELLPAKDVETNSTR